MRRADEHPLGPEALDALTAIDATLAGDAVDPRHAELAELALILAAERPQPSAAFTTGLDRRVASRFAGEPRLAGARRWLFAPAAGLTAALVVAVVVVLSSAASPPGALDLAPAPAAHSPAAAAAGSVRRPPATIIGASTTASSATSASASSGAPAGASSASSAAVAPSAPAPPPNGRKVVQSAQLDLNTAPSRIDNVAQQVFDVVGSEQGIVNRSTVTATGNPEGYAEFELSFPSASLSDAMTALSRLRYASVVSRTDATQDVNGQFNGATRRLADARALRTSLLKQLAAAVTQTQIDSLNAQIHDAEASISSDQAALGRLDHQINYSQVTLTINAAVAPVAPVSRGSSFTIARGAHDAARVLTVAAGVALVALAAGVPLALLGALAWWLGRAVRRRRRQQALDLA